MAPMGDRQTRMGRANFIILQLQRNSADEPWELLRNVKKKG